MDDDLLYLCDIRSRLQRIREYTRDGRRAFMNSNLMQDAVVRNIEMIGYTWTCLSPEYRLQLPDFPWRLIGARVDYLMHQRDPDRLKKLVWLAVRRSVPELERAMRRHFPDLNEGVVRPRVPPELPVVPAPGARADTGPPDGRAA
ncbi:HepT-like ribonuclease domain-containing protein [Paraburkholderia tuberum]|uniref:Uncharacterized conserved protein, contains HEPN domain n=1 Tax=Paraburkholderia tuberum TaxID=157910 RepID=A0A1H1KK85_9BURK|nr:hypothetical protein [Paraburkholderia tuberum]SDR62497.1 Uncharacterized conserved protein, contains HEPN domain [Paraburkholderia tuberum]